jgi:hypothetical protein
MAPLPSRETPFRPRAFDSIPWRHTKLLRFGNEQKFPSAVLDFSGCTHALLNRCYWLIGIENDSCIERRIQTRDAARN